MLVKEGGDMINPFFFAPSPALIISYDNEFAAVSNPESSRDLTIFIMSFSFSFDITVWYYSFDVALDSRIVLLIHATANDAAAVNPTGILVSSFFISGKWTFNNGARSLPTNPPGFIILEIWVLYTLMSHGLLEMLFLASNGWTIVKALRRLASFLSVLNKLGGKLFSPVPIVSDDNLRVTPLPINVP